MRLLGMDAYKAVIEKRDKREFDSRPVPEEILVKILQATRMAGSGKNRQTGRVVVVTNQEGRESVAASGDFGDWINQASFALVFAATIITIKILGNILENITNALALGIISKLLGAIFGSIKINLHFSGGCLYNNDKIIVLIQTDFPEPVVPAIKR